MKAIVRRPAPEVGLELPDLHPVLARVYAARDVRQPQDLDRSLQALLPYTGLGGIDAAAQLLAQALAENWRILVIGDFDADGATSSALAVRALRLLGAASVEYLVPNRFHYGYGLTPEIVAVAATRQPDLILTVDNGVSSVAGVAAARALGMRVLVTDHHLPGATLPAADAMVNPNLPGDPFPSKCLAGVGVIFYVMLALRALLREQGWFAATGRDEPNLAQFLDLVALGTVADVVPLDSNNRILVAQGLARIRAGLACPGVRALLEVAGRRPEGIAAADLGFAVGPRLNAAGRLEDMAVGIECLLSDHAGRAAALAAQLDALNRERRAIEAQMKEQAWQQLEGMLDGAAAADLPVGLCLFEPAWHEGVIGILASRVKERLHRPVIAFARSTEPGLIKGSARSIAGVHIRDVLDAIAARHPELLTRFGGHAMAAGLTLQEEDFESFALAFEREVARHVTPEQLRGVVLSDGELSGADLGLELAEQLRNGGPWGQGFPEPVFDGEFEIVQRRVVGNGHLKLVLRCPVSAAVVDAIAFNLTDTGWPAGVERVQAAYRLDINEYQGRRCAQLLIEHLEPV